MDLRHLSDKVLHLDTKFLVQRERRNTTDILYHIKEIERRRSFSDMGYSSLFEYAVKELGYSESSAMRRIHAARLLNKLPELKTVIEQGRMTLSNLSDASKAFQKENITDKEEQREILKGIEGKSSRDCEKKLMELFPPALPIPKEKLKLVAPEMHSLTILITEMTLNKINELRNVLAPRVFTYDQLLDVMLTISLEYLKKRKFRLSAPSAPKAQSKTRYVPAIIKKEVYVRDEGKCSICGTTFRLEYDHKEPFARGGQTQKENLRLLCFSCNQRSRIKAGL